MFCIKSTSFKKQEIIHKLLLTFVEIYGTIEMQLVAEHIYPTDRLCANFLPSVQQNIKRIEPRNIIPAVLCAIFCKIIFLRRDALE